MMDDVPLPQTQADIDKLSEAEVLQHLARVAQQIPIERVSAAQWMAREEYRLLMQRWAILQAQRVERLTENVHDMTRTIKRLTWVNTVAVVLALLEAIY